MRIKKSYKYRIEKIINIQNNILDLNFGKIKRIDII